MLTDSHCHLDMLDGVDTPDALQAVLAEARDAGVERMLCVGVDLERFDAMAALVAGHEQISISCGIHPAHVVQTGTEPDEEALQKHLANPRVVAVGETGLDYHYGKGREDEQRGRFRRHMRVACALGKPVIVHTRDARRDTLAILDEEGVRDCGGVIHCFTEDLEFAQAALDLGMYISFSGIVTFRSAEKIHEVAREMPLDRMLVETDSPYLTPVPLRGKPNRPAYVRHVAEFIARLRGLALEEVAETTTSNYLRLFAVP